MNKKIIIFYDCDEKIERFDLWYWGYFKVDSIREAKKLFKKWFEEYINDDDLISTTDRYQYTIKKAKEYGYEYCGNSLTREQYEKLVKENTPNVGEYGI